MPKFATEVGRDVLVEYGLNRTELLQVIDSHLFFVGDQGEGWESDLPLADATSSLDIAENIKASRSDFDKDVHSLWQFNGTLLVEKLRAGKRYIHHGAETYEGTLASVHDDFFIYKDSSGQVRAVFSSRTQDHAKATEVVCDVLRERPLCAKYSDNRYLFSSWDGNVTALDFETGEGGWESTLDITVHDDQGSDVEGPASVVCTFSLSTAVVGVVLLLYKDSDDYSDHCLKFFEVNDDLKACKCLASTFNPLLLDFPLPYNELENSQNLTNLFRVCKLPSAVPKGALVYCPYASSSLWVVVTNGHEVSITDAELEVRPSTEAMFSSCGFSHITPLSPACLVAVQTDRSLLLIRMTDDASVEEGSIDRPPLNDSSSYGERKLQGLTDTPSADSKSYVPQSYRLDEDDEEEEEDNSDGEDRSGSDIFAQDRHSKAYDDFDGHCPYTPMDSNALAVEKNVDEMLQELKGVALLQEDDARDVWLSVCDAWQRFEDKIKSLEGIQLDPETLNAAQFLESIDRGQAKMVENIRILDAYKRTSSENKIQHIQNLISQASRQGQEAQAVLNTLGEALDLVLENILMDIRTLEDLQENLTGLHQLNGLEAAPNWNDLVKPILRRMSTLVSQVSRLHTRVLHPKRLSSATKPVTSNNIEALVKQTDTSSCTKTKPWKTYGVPRELKSVFSPPPGLACSLQESEQTSQGSSSSKELAFANEALRLCIKTRQLMDQYDVSLRRVAKHHTRSSRECSPVREGRDNSMSRSISGRNTKIESSLVTSDEDRKRLSFFSNVMIGSQALMTRRRYQIEMWKVQQQGSTKTH